MLWLARHQMIFLSGVSLFYTVTLFVFFFLNLPFFSFCVLIVETANSDYVLEGSEGTPFAGLLM